MRVNYEKLMRAKKTTDLVGSCTVSIEQAIGVAQASIGGTVFDVKVKEMNHQVVWRVKMLRAGERVKVYVDAGSGNIIEVKAEQALKTTARDHEVCGASIQMGSH
jgi:uncharacterized membrane protein YkoI